MVYISGLFLLCIVVTCHNTIAERIYCLTCTAVISPRHCHSIHRCEEGDVCYTERYISLSGETLFNTGCISTMECKSNMTQIDLKRAHSPEYPHGTECIECCSGDACNSHGCGSPAYPDTRGPLCFNCQQTIDPALCRSVKVCYQHEVCHLHEEQEFGDSYFVSSCAQKYTCHKESSIDMGNVIGKRSGDVCNKCCSSDLCNNNCFPDSQTSKPSTPTRTTTKPTSPPVKHSMDCYDLYTSGNTRSGVYTVYPWGATEQSVSVYCEMDVSPGGWTVFQRRGIDKLVHFNRTWLEYKNGFGNISTDFWLGNDVIHQMTTIGSNKLYIQLKDTSQRSHHARFESFSIGPETDKYRLHVGGKFSGNITDDFVTSGSYILNGQPFATPDRPDTSHCAARLGGGWWFHGCEYVYLNGPFSTTYWVWKGSVNEYNLLEYTAMMMTRG